MTLGKHWQHQRQQTTNNFRLKKKRKGKIKRKEKKNKGDNLESVWLESHLIDWLCTNEYKEQSIYTTMTRELYWIGNGRAFDWIFKQQLEIAWHRPGHGYTKMALQFQDV